MQAQRIYEFGPFRMNPVEQILLREGQVVSLTPKAFETLSVLVENTGHLVGKEELIQRVWPDTIVEESNLNVIIHMLRKALGDDLHEPKYIETLPKRGYRFVADVRTVWDQDEERNKRTSAATSSIADSTAPAAFTPPRSRLSEFVFRHSRHRPSLALMTVGILAVTLVIALSLLWRSDQHETGQPIAASSTMNSVAVLPFKVLGSDEDDEYLSLGLADALITSLTHTRQVIVRQTSAVTKYLNVEIDPLVAGREQGVEAVLDGQVQRIGERVRVTARLVRTSDGAPLWADRFDEQFTHIFAVQDAIAEKVAQAMIRTMAGLRSDTEPKRFTRRYTENNDAYQAYLKGRYFWEKRTVDSLRKAMTHFQQAIDLDPNYALAFVGLAEAYTLHSFFTIAAPKNVFPKAKDAANQALSLDPTLAEARVALGQVKSFYEWDWLGAEEQFQAGIRLNPNYPNLHHWRSLNLMAMGRLEEARSSMKRALELDPLLLISNVNLGRIDYYAGRYDQAIAQYKRTIELDPTFTRAHLRLGMAYVQQGRYGEAFIEYAKTGEVAGDTPQVAALIAHALARSGRKSEARAALAQLLERAKHQFVPSYSIGLIYTGLGETDQALAWLERAYADRSSDMIYFKVEPMFAPLRSDPRYQHLLRRMGLAP